ncbi:MAG: S8 family serine peptidase [Polyangiales bacterium]
MRRATVALFALLASPLALTPHAEAIWPAPLSVPREGLSDPMYWPSDPGFGLHGATDSGQWDMYSWVPASARSLAGFRAPELALGAGSNIDSAWQVTIGDPRVLIAVLDSGIKWDERDLQLKAALNVGELPMPRGAASYDANGDGVVNVADYLNDPRVTCGGTTLPHPLRACRGADGMPDDPNRNGLFDAGDLIRAFSDGVDGDHDGYVDDIAGWDFFKDDNDPYDDVRYGHGTGEANDSTAETDNGIGGAGVCPRCMFVPLRVGDSFTTDASDYAQAVVYATDARYGAGRVRVVQEALGSLNLPRFATQAMDYAYAHDLVVMASASDLNSNHANMPGTANHAVYTHAVMYTGPDAQHSTSFLGFNNCTNYGPQLQLSVASTSCSSGAVGRGSGVAGLLYSQALASALDPPLSAEEARQLLIGTVDDVNIPESLPTASNYDTTIYPSLPGWDQRFGYGRVNARRAVEAVRDGRLPPEVDITSPRWFTTMFADRDPTRRLRVEGRIAARRAARFDYTVEWGRGVEVRDGTWTTIRSGTAVTTPVTDALAELDLADVTVDNVGAGPGVNAVEYRYAITVRVRATAHYGGAAGDVTGEARRTFFVHRDPTLLLGFPVDVGSSVESSPHLADLDGDGRREVVIADSGGLVHAFEPDGSELRGFPVHTGLQLGRIGTPTRLAVDTRRSLPLAPYSRGWVCVHRLDDAQCHCGDRLQCVPRGQTSPLTHTFAPPFLRSHRSRQLVSSHRRAGVGSISSVGSRRCARMRTVTARSWIVAMNFIAPSQRGHFSASTPHTRCSNVAQSMRVVGRGGFATTTPSVTVNASAPSRESRPGSVGTP